ncbi:hypothetical protein [Bacillus sp. Marseille-P3661]|uniref:hypothetical protein n=1 Tax=Bacillus sp. Marseille-P3661 TaxID=1936234 RepID=UPI000C816601|nr:hypothetical protein [Bacillus sp. Marseille-P3661]
MKKNVGPLVIFYKNEWEVKEMSLKLIELQVALPRTQDIGKLQEQLQQKGQHTQDHLAAVNHKQDKQKRKQVNKQEKTNQSHFHNKNQHQSFELRAVIKNKQQENISPPHPYKGITIDIEG